MGDSTIIRHSRNNNSKNNKSADSVGDTIDSSSNGDGGGGGGLTARMMGGGDIEDLHEQALMRGSTTYTDPSTGFTVFTELAHLRRGRCCGAACRHCPYGWTNVADGERNRPAKVTSGDYAAIDSLLHQIQERAMAYKKQQHKTKEQPPPLQSKGTAKPKTAIIVEDEDEDDDEQTRTTTEEGKTRTEIMQTTTKKKTGGSHGGRLTDKNVPYTRGGDQGTSQLLTGERRSKNDWAFESMGTVDELCSVIGVVYAHLQQEQQDQSAGATAAAATVPVFQPTSVTVVQLNEWLLDIMSRLFDIGSHLAKPPVPSRTTKKNNNDDDASSESEDDDEEDEKSRDRFVADGIGGGFDDQHVKDLEDWIDLLTNDLPELRSFVLPASPSMAVAQCHVARTVCRRAERTLVVLVVQPPQQQQAKNKSAALCDPRALQYLNRLSDFLFTAARWMHRYVAQQPSDVEYKRPHPGARQRVRTNSATPTTTSTKSS